MIAPEIANSLPQIRILCHRYGVERMSLFGSATTENFSPDTSDVDCLIKFFRNQKNLGSHFLDLVDDLEKTWQRPVDIVFEGAIRNYILRDVIENSKILIYEHSS